MIIMIIIIITPLAKIHRPAEGVRERGSNRQITKNKQF